MSGGTKLWGGRFQKPTHELVDQLNASLPFDRRLARHDILGSLAHVTMLARQGIVPLEDARAIARGLRAILQEIQEERFEFRLADEDIHLSVERRLRELIGAAAGRLHTARSRNDQVALDFRLWMREAILEVGEGIVETGRALLDLANEHCDVVLPGYTHLQRAQPLLLAHHLHAYVAMLARDLARLQELYRRVNRSPLGSGALAGVPYPIDRAFVAELLAMDGILENSIDAVSDRDFALEFLADLAILMAHLSRLAEELVLWSSSEFGFIEFDDAFATGSSIMPQKKNPDVAELLRGKSGRVFGHLIGLLTVVKGLPLAYNKDLQEDKEGVFDALDTVALLLRVLPPMLRTLRIDRERMHTAAEQGFTLATDVADALVRAGVPFREAHEAVGRLVAYCIAEGKTFGELAADELARFHPRLAEVVFPRTVWDAVRAREHPGGTGPEHVARALEASRSELERTAGWLQQERQRIDKAFARLLSEEFP
ncbi:Argininosuccinate lyase [bacterium HR28]|uniref:Argininosuccinate lyase n=1 Tax=Thermomicrobium roseum TaxID=500 RepID=A0A7C1G5N0_THERO|nr:Argininosuccinate lyase [bacterium HR28]